MTKKAERIFGAALLGALLLLPVSPDLGAMPAQEQGRGGKDSGVTASGVMATTAWTAAFVHLAGVDQVRVLAPYEMRHPPEYELKPSDIEAVANARLIVFAGYETMVDKLKDAAGRNEIQVLQIDTRNDLISTRAAVERIAAVLGTESQARENLRRLEGYFPAWREELSDNAVGLIIDNWHNEVGAPLEETLQGSRRVSWINFPGAFETRSLEDVLEYNRRAPGKVMEGKR